MPIPHLKPRMYEPPLRRDDDDTSPRALKFIKMLLRFIAALLLLVLRPFRAVFRSLFRRLSRGRRASASSVLLGVFLVIMLVVGIGGLTTAGVLAYFARTLPDPSHLAFRTVKQSTKIYDRTGTVLLYDIHGEERRTVIPLADIPRHAVNAAIAIEDKNFYSHQGLSFRSILRAAFFDIFGNTIGRLVLRRPEGAGGASTLTQQLAKNAILTSERTLSRKLKEAFLAYRIEKSFSKDQILALYFNEIPYGSVSYGIEAAAQTVFGKHARELDLPEAALLAALPKAPTRLSPYGNHTDELLARIHRILDLMAEQGMISKNEAVDAKAVAVLERVKPKRENIIAPHFVLYVKELLTERYGEQAVEEGGFTVTTSLDAAKQELAEKAIADNITAVEKAGGSNAALVALDPRTGEILAMVGSRDYFDDTYDGQVNVVLRPRQPGSSIKPIVYAAAFAKGYTPTTVLFDVVTQFKTDQGAYIPHNYDSAEHGPVTMRTALAGSLNIPAVKTIYLAGVNRVLDLAESLGYSTFSDRSRFGLALVLGGAEVKLLEHASAIGSLATDGTHHVPVALLKVTDARGAALDEWKAGEGTTTLDAEVAREVTDIMQDNLARAFIFGERNYLTLPDRPVAAKTGTTNNFRDAWTVGFVPSLVAGVWVGNNDNSEMKRGADGSKIAAPIWRQFMRDALANVAPEAFTPPASVITGKPILDGVPYPQTSVRVDRISGKLATAHTPPELVESRTYGAGSIHDTLFYVQKDDPRGPLPVDPADDPQFPFWEEAVQRWAAEHGVLSTMYSGAPPTDYDDVHLPEYYPSVRILNPTEGAVVASRQTSIDIESSSPRFPLARVEIRIDGTLVGSAAAPVGSITIIIPPSITRGFHVLETRAYDSVQNAGTTTVNINLVAD